MSKNALLSVLSALILSTQNISAQEIKNSQKDNEKHYKLPKIQIEANKNSIYEMGGGA
ncbi:hypothetical protein [Helicobacter sp. 12S02232-10]|uniref:hypothetical protein n=1 Tax=Helicobacter sp. 12S02232-10 TaxID=1476197 RepID=UPI0015DFD81C|nr:hypothetical protein [Helicobacter sp. 12S02232-10]